MSAWVHRCLRPACSPHTKPAKMATRTRKAKASLLDDRINILNKDAVEASPAKLVFKTVSTTLALVRVGAPFCICLWALINNSGQDKMIDDKDSVQLSEYCFNVCEVLKAAVQGKNADTLNDSVRVALEDLERCVGLSFSICSLAKQLQGHTRDRADT